MPSLTCTVAVAVWVPGYTVSLTTTCSWYTVPSWSDCWLNCRVVLMMPDCGGFMENPIDSAEIQQQTSTKMYTPF